MTNTTKTTTRLAAIAGLALAASSAHAAVSFIGVDSVPGIPDTATDELAFAGDVANDDLLTGLTGTISGTPLGLGDVANFNDGLGRAADSTINTPGALTEIAWVGDTGTILDFVIGGGDNGLGYDISGVTSFADWDGAGFMNQNYTIYLRELGGSYGAAYATVFYQATTSLTEGGATKLTVTDDAGLLGSGIDAIRFEFLDTVSQDNGGTVFSEIDVFGTATAVPEPSATALLGLGGLALIFRRRK